jgi:hypothetical protein
MMSGGHFNYDQYKIGQIADDIQLLIDTNNSQEKDQWGDKIGGSYPPEIIQQFSDAITVLRRAQVYAQRIDWLVCGDDGPDSFLERLAEELADD